MNNEEIKNFIQAIHTLEGRDVIIHIAHKLFGDQKLKCNFQMVDDACRLGFSVGGEAKFIKKKEINNFGIDNHIYYFADDVMRIEIKMV